MRRVIWIALTAVLAVACSTPVVPSEHETTVARPEAEYVSSTSVDETPRLLQADWKRLDRVHVGWIAVVDHGPLHRSCALEVSFLDNDGFLLKEDREYVSGTGIIKVRGQTYIMPDLASQVASIAIEGDCS